LCLEEYTEYIKQYTYLEPNHYLKNKGSTISIYYVSAEEEGITIVPILNGEQHHVSGNNKDGFVITVFNEQRSEDNEC
jgi:zinc D-Ala-D-Ala dipeptidase/carboxypeptidase